MAVVATAFPSNCIRAPRILNHDILNCTHESVRGNHLYSGRALGISESDDLIQLHPLLRSEWPAITAHYRRIGLPHASDVIWDVSYNLLSDCPRHEVSVFYFGETVDAIRPDTRWMGVVEYINDKNNFMDLADELGMDVPRTLRFKNRRQVIDYQSLPYPCYVKASISVSGVGIYRCETPGDVREVLARFVDDVPLQIQEEIVTNLFLNLQYEVSRGTLRRLAVTDQVLDGFAHQGNRYPSGHEPWGAVEPMARWMAVRGMKGIFAFDVGVVKTEYGCRFPPIECNPRFNGASYPTLVASKLGLSAWLAVQMNTRYRHLSDLDLSGIEYDPISKRGVVIVNWGTVLTGKVGFLLVGSVETQEALRLELKRRI